MDTITARQVPAADVGRLSRHGAAPVRAARPPRTAQESGAIAMPLASAKPNVLIVDLNNFATFPTLAIGMLVASLRNAGLGARVLSPLAYDVPAALREHRESFKDHVARSIHLSTSHAFRAVRDAARDMREWWINRPNERVLRECRREMASGVDAVLLSAYLQHYQTVRAIGELAQQLGIPVLLGGPMFNIPETAQAWRGLPGLAGVVGAESDLVLPQIVEALCNREDLLRFDGVTLPDGRASAPARPLRDLDRIPVPDFTDFPWDRYPTRVVPVMAGRGCQWAKCSFCSDVVSVSGRTFRTRALDSVMHELREQWQRHQTTNFIFLDIKLNSSPAMFRGIAADIQRHVPGAQWIGTVHVDQRKDNGLSARDLRAAAGAGMRRISFGLESGSQRLLDRMEKGCTTEGNSEFIRQAHAAGLSVRCTMFKGCPGETAEDLALTADFLEAHSPYLDRVRFNEFSVSAGTPIAEALAQDPFGVPQVQVTGWRFRVARAKYINRETGGKAYRKAKARTLRAVYEINRRRIRSSAAAFDGMM